MKEVFVDIVGRILIYFIRHYPIFVVDNIRSILIYFIRDYQKVFIFFKYVWTMRIYFSFL